MAVQLVLDAASYAIDVQRDSGTGSASRLAAYSAGKDSDVAAFAGAASPLGLLVALPADLVICAPAGDGPMAAPTSIASGIAAPVAVASGQRAAAAGVTHRRWGAPTSPVGDW